MVGAPPRRWLAPAVVAVLTALVFLPALKNGFVSWDDDKNFIDNFHFRGLGPEQVRWMWSTFHLGHYVPLSWMTLGFDHVMWGMDPYGYHLTNVVLHAATAVAVFAVARQILARGFPGTTGGIDFAAAVVALLFAVHPLRVESVAWITERRDVLSGLFYFSSIAAYLRSVSATHLGRRWYGASLGLFVLALLSKGSAVTLPAALLVLNIYPFRRIGGAAGWRTPSAWQVTRGLLPFVALGVVAIAITLTALQAEEQLPPEGKIAASLFSLAFYLTKTIAPTGLSPLYALPRELDPFAVKYLLSAGLIAAACGAAFAYRRRAPAVAAAWFGFIVILLPFVGVHQNGPQIVADRYAYNASVALALLAGAAILAARGRMRAIFTAAATVLVAVFSALTVQQIGIWHDPLSLWSRVVAIEPESAIGNTNLGNVLTRTGHASDAIALYHVALRTDPRYPDAHNNLGVALSATGRNHEAIDHFRQALDIRRDYGEALGNLGASLAAQGDLQGALQSYAAAFVADPNNADVQVNWANVLVRSGKFGEAEPHYAEAIRLRPDNMVAFYNWGMALAQAGRLQEAAAQLELARQLEPGNMDTQRSLDRVRQALARGDTITARRRSP